MKKNIHLELGKTYIATFSDGREVEFTVVGGADPYEIDAEGKRIKHTELLNNFKEIREKENN